VGVILPAIPPMEVTFLGDTPGSSFRFVASGTPREGGVKERLGTVKKA
jgi:hypothetical protein